MVSGFSYFLGLFQVIMANPDPLQYVICCWIQVILDG